MHQSENTRNLQIIFQFFCTYLYGYINYRTFEAHFLGCPDIVITPLGNNPLGIELQSPVHSLRTPTI